MLKRVFLLLLLLPIYLVAQYPSSPSNYVTDEADVLSASQEQILNAKLKTFEDSSSNQLFVYIATSLNGSDLNSVSQSIFQSWKPGSKGKDNGVLITVFVEDHKFRIQTGYGLEGNLPDLLTKKIQDEQMAPDFKQNDFYTGLDKGIDQLIYYTAHTYEPEKTFFLFSDVKNLWIAYAFNAFLLITLLYDLFNKKASTKLSVNRKILLSLLAFFSGIIPFFGAIALLFLHYLVTDKTPGGTYGSSGGSYRSSGSWSSGSSFGGGGGGRSGGGGSSSSW